MRKYNENNFSKAMDMYGVETKNISTPEDFNEEVVRANRISMYIDLDAICSSNDLKKKRFSKMHYIIKKCVTDEIFGYKPFNDVMEKIYEALDKIILYSEMGKYDGMKIMHAVDTGIVLPSSEHLTIRSVSMDNGEYTTAFVYGSKSVNIDITDYTLSNPYQIALDIYKSKKVSYAYVTDYGKVDPYSVMFNIKDDIHEVAAIIDDAKSNQHLSIRDILTTPSMNMMFIPTEAINVGIYVDGKRKIIPYILGVLMNTSSKEFRGYAIRATATSAAYDPSSKCTSLSLQGNSELFLELINKHDYGSIESILIDSVRVLAEARLSYYNRNSIEADRLIKEFNDLKFHDDYNYHEKENAIKVG